MKRIDLIVALTKSNIWTEDRFGNFKGEIEHYIFSRREYKDLIRENIKDSEYRLKIQTTSVRFEKKILVCNKNEWLNIISDYIKNIDVVNFGDKTYLKIGSIKIPI